MTEPSPASRRLAASLHRLLLRRLVGMTVAISLLLGGVVLWREVARYDATILQHTVQAGEGFRRHILGELDKPGLDEGKGIQAALDAIPAPQRPDPLGRTIYARITDPAGRPLAERFVPGYPDVAEVERYMNAHRFPFTPGGKDLFREVTRIHGKPHLHMGMALTNSRGQDAAYVESLYAVSDAVLDGIASGILRTVLLVVLATLATTLLLYPVIMRLFSRVTDLSAHLQEANLETLSVLGSAIAKRDSDTDQHNYRVTIYAVRLAEALGLSGAAIRPLIKGAMLHDVGKIGIRDAVLLKPGPLTGAEYAEMRQHVQHGRDIVAQAAWLADAVDVISGHHERYDGHGYDQGLRDGQIPLGARLFAIADVFDALTSRRPYKQALDFEQTMRQMEDGRGAQFDPELLDAFQRIARELYDHTAALNEAGLKASLRDIFQAYFTADIEVMLEGVRELLPGRRRTRPATD